MNLPDTVPINQQILCLILQKHHPAPIPPPYTSEGRYYRLLREETRIMEEYLRDNPHPAQARDPG